MCSRACSAKPELLSSHCWLLQPTTEKLGRPLKDICQLHSIWRSADCVAMHRNPAIQRVMKEILGDRPNILLLDAPDYLEFANL